MTAPPTAPRSLGSRIAVALLIGVAAALMCSLFLGLTLIRDFELFWWSAKAITRGLNPYTAIGPSGSFFEWFVPHSYPVTAMVPIIPLTMLPTRVALVVFVGVSTAGLAWALTRDGYARLPVFLSGSFLYAAVIGQWSPLLAAAALTPALGFVLLAKPPIGLALFLLRPTRLAAVGCIALVAVSLMVMPTWPMEWWRSTMQIRSHFSIPLLVPGGQLLALSLLRWKRPEARFLFVLSCVPHSLLPYEGVLLFLVAITLWENVTLAALSWALLLTKAWLGGELRTGPERLELYAQLMIVLMYLPALLMVLRRPNEGDTRELVSAGLDWLRRPRLRGAHE